MSTRPDTDHYLCVLFPLPSSGSGKEAGPKAQIDPKLVWIKNNGQIKEVVGGLPDVPFRRMRFPLKKDVGSEKEFITTYNHGNFASSIYRLNPNIHKIFPQDYWRGAVLVMFGLGDVKNPSGFRDFKVDDMKHVQHCLTNFDIADELVDSEVCRLIFATALVGGLAATAS